MVYKLTFNDPHPPTVCLNIDTILTFEDWDYDIPLKHKFILLKSGLVYTDPFTLLFDYNFNQPVAGDSLYNIVYQEIPLLIRNKKIQKLLND